jgi:hypothetical protein
MEVYRFTADAALGLVTDLAVEPSGDLLVLSQARQEGTRRQVSLLTRCDYRGEPQERVEFRYWPEPYRNLPVHRLFLREGRLLLVNVPRMLVVEATIEGVFLRGWDLGEPLGIDEADRPNVQIEGLSVDGAGNLLVTVPVLFRAFVVSPEGEARAFGSPGSAPGRFGNLGGIVADDRGRVFVADKLRNVVMVFDETLQFLEEFGYRGNRPENLRGPSQLAVGEGGALYITQRGGQGVSVFTVGEE